MTRLEKIVGEASAAFLLHWYKEARKTHDIDTIITFKSFVTRMIEAQNEDVPNPFGYSERWASVEQYIAYVLEEKSHIGNNTPLEFIIKRLTESYSHPFGYEREKHFSRLL